MPFRIATSRPAQKAYLGTALLVTASCVLLSISSLAYWIFYYNYVPQPGVDRTIHLQFGNGHPYGITSFTDALVANQAYDMSILLHMPRTTINLESGNFMLDLTLLPSSPSTFSTTFLPSAFLPSNDTIAKSRRTAIMTHKSSMIDTVTTVSFLPLYMSGISKESEWLSVKMFDNQAFAKGSNKIPQAAKLMIEADKVMQFYDAKLHIIAVLSGLRWFLYHHRVISFLVFTAAFWASSMAVMGGVWLFLSLYLDPASRGRPKAGKKELAENIAIKTEPEPSIPSSGFAAYDELSDTSRTFPTLGGQKPLKYESSGAERFSSVKREDHVDDTRIRPLLSAAHEADDEDDFEDAGASSSGFRDSGIGTSLEDERRAGIQRRKKALLGSSSGR